MDKKKLTALYKNTGEGAIYLFPKTISSIYDRLDELRNQFHRPDGVDPTGANSRLLAPGRVSVFEDMGVFESLLARSRRLSPPDQNCCIQIGHKVTIISQNRKKLKLHLCSELDVKYLADKGQLEGQLLSIESPLGVLILGKSVGHEIRHDQQRFRITEIKVSEYL